MKAFFQQIFKIKSIIVLIVFSFLQLSAYAICSIPAGVATYTDPPGTVCNYNTDNNDGNLVGSCGFNNIYYDQCNDVSKIYMAYRNHQDQNNLLGWMTITMQVAGFPAITFHRYNRAWSSQFINNYGFTSQYCGQQYHTYVEGNIPNSILSQATSGYNPSREILVKVSGYWSTGSSWQTFDHTRKIILETPAATSTPTLLSNTCDSKTFNWTNPTIPTCLNGLTHNIQIYADGILQPHQNGATPQYTLNTTDDNTSIYIQHRFSQNGYHLYSAASHAYIAGKLAPPPPADFEASTDRCDGKIRMEWILTPDADNYHIYRDGVFIHSTGNGTTGSYIDDDVALVRGQFYNYTIYSHEGSCGWSVASTVSSGVSPADPDGTENVWLDVIPNVGIRINFNKDDLANSYKIERNLLGGGGASFFTVPTGDTSYLDQSVTVCQTYEYRVISFNDCAVQGIASDSSRQASLTPDFSTVFNPNSLDASKGYYPNRIELSWSVDNNSNFINAYKIYRRVLGSGLDSIQITSQNSGTNLYQDNLTDAGVLYEYFIIAEAQCEQSTVYSNVASAIGYRAATGVINGEVNYTGGIAVEGVKVLVNNVSGSNGNSFHFNNSAVGQNLTPNFDNTSFPEITVESWVKLDSTLNGNWSLISDCDGINSIDLGGNATDLSFKIEDNLGTIITASTPILATHLANYIHLAGVYQGGTNGFIKLYVNGSEVASQSTSIANVELTSICLGQNLNGLQDESKIWSDAKDSTYMFDRHSIKVSGVEQNLIGFWNFDENIGAFAYDKSNVSGNFNKNHIPLPNSIDWSTIIPTANQLVTGAYTNANGDYFVIVPYAGNGQNFTVTPSFGTHQFNPGDRVLFIGDNSTIQNNIDFADISSFQASGRVRYKGSTCFVEGAFVKVDGNFVVDGNNLPVRTNANGEFDIQVPIGNHNISVEMNGHTFEEGKFPPTGNFDFQLDGTFVDFIDSTRVKVIGRVVGGLREANKFPGRSKNNIGVMDVVFTTQADCDTVIAQTDPVTGEYIAYVLPLKHKMDIIDPTLPFGAVSPINAYFQPFDLVDLTNIPPMQTLIDTLAYDSLFMTYTIDSVQFQKQLDYIYRTEPKIDVFAQDTLGLSLIPFTGDAKVEMLDYNNTNSTPFVVPSSVFPYDVFTQVHEGVEEYLYRAYILTYEEYVNGSVRDSVPVADGQLLVENELADAPLITINLSDVVTDINELSYAVHEFIPGEPNFVSDPIQQFSYTKKLYIAVQTPNGTVIPWLPLMHPITNSPDVYRAYMLGLKSNGANFFTNGPETVDFVLRDPPGGESFATRQVGEEISSSESWGWELGVNFETVDKINVGAKLQIGLGVSTATEVLNSNSIGSKTTVSGGRSGSVQRISENTAEWSTNANADNIGSASDLYIGKSSNVEFGTSNYLKLVPDSMCNSIECETPSLGNGYSVAVTSSISMVPGGYNTGFIYSQDFIETTLLPTLINLRNVLLQSNPKYTANPALGVGHPNYGKNNDDPVFGTAVSSPDPFLANIPEDFVGPSYTYVPTNAQDSLVDSLRLMNQQIRLWEEAIRQNEFEKVIIENPVMLDSMRNHELAVLEAIYQDINDKYDDLVIATNVVSLAGTIVGVVAPAPGSAIASTVKFATTTGTKIAALELMQSKLNYEAKKQNINDKFANITGVNHSISGGASFTASKTSSLVASTSNTMEFGSSIAFLAEVEGKVSNTGLGASKGLSVDFTKRSANDASTDKSATVSYTLFDSDVDDYFSVDVFPSIYGWGPIFKRKVGGGTGCPFEPEEVTNYYAPGTVIAQSTLQRDLPAISVNQPIITNVPVDQAAVFTLNIANLSETGDDQNYKVKAISAQNPYGAIITINGTSIPQSPLVLSGSSVNMTLSIEKGPGGTYNYDSLLIVAQSVCEDEILDSVYVSAHFLPTCTDVELIAPIDNWVLNNNFNDTFPIQIGGYDINFYDLERYRFEYKPSSASNWIGLQSYWKDTTGFPTYEPIPTNDIFTFYLWETNQINDGNYDLRVTSECALADVSSPVYSGVMDRINPHPFGTPVPGDGILDSNEDIKIKFNETIDLGSLTSFNFDIRGVLNQTTLSHYTSLYFDGIDDEVKVLDGANIQSRDFTIEFWAKRDAFGEQVIFSQGDSPLENLSIGFNAADNIVAKIGPVELSTIVTVNNTNWHHYAVAYSFDNGPNLPSTMEIYFDGTLVNPGNITIGPAFVASDDLYFGKNSSTNASYFNGNLHEVRVWNKYKTISEIIPNMNISLSKSVLGLLHNWKIDEATGILAIDNVRRRDGVLNGATWEIRPNGYSMEFDGVDDFLVINNAGNVAISDEMDFTLEFWYNSSSTNIETMFSNGSGTGLAADSLLSWNIEKDSQGQIHVKHAGLDFIAVSNNTFDGTWHHFALVLDRTGSLSSYLDGNLQYSLQALDIKEFGGSSLFLGARTNYALGVSTQDQYFDGMLDEFRFWNTARKVEQIARDKQNRLLGDEFGLLTYLPMEDYQIFAGFPVLDTSIIDVADASHIALKINGADYNVNTPTIKIQRPIQPIQSTYSVNNDEIIITPLISQELIENITIDITVKDVLDLHGNSMQSPKTWIAYIDKNQVIWQDDLLVFDKDFGTSLNFTSAVVNNGGATKDFDITNLPAWLSASQTSGTIAPNSVQQITFTVDPNVNIGDYIEDIHLTTDFGFDEKLTIELNVREEEPSWTVNPSNFINSMSIIGFIEINDVVSTSEEDILAVFVNDTCRGSAHLEYVAQLDRYLVYLDVYSNLNNGENLDFKVWDASSGTIFSEIAPDTISFVANSLVGSVSSPQKFETSYEIEVAIPMNTGWNWVSHFLLNPDSLNLDKTLESLESVTGDEIKGLSNYSNYLENTGWVGSLNQTGIVPEDGYKLKVSQIDTLLIKGDIIDPTTRNINLAQGWNWIGFISVRNQSVTQALGNLNPTDGDIIKAQSQFAVYDNTLGWVGSLQTMKPGTGYMYYTSNAASFVYPAIGQYKFGIVDKNEIYKNKTWTVKPGQYAANMTVISSLETDCEYIENNGNIAIGVFDEKANCRAVNLLENLEENQYNFLTVGGNTTANLKFGIMDTKTGRNYDLEETIEFNSNKRAGSITEPFMLKISDEICFKMQFEKEVDQVDNEEIVFGEEIMEVYPTVFEEEIDLYYLSKERGKKSTAKLFNIWGQLIYKEIYQEEEGYNKKRFDVRNESLSIGVYHLIIEDSNAETHSFKIIKK